MAASVDDLVSMIIFGRVVEAQSFTAAAKRMGMSKSAVSSRVADLENRLGMRLLNRTTRKVSLTESGIEVYGRCARMVVEADAATALAQDLTRSVSGTLKMNAPQALSRLYLAPLLNGFLQSHPTLRIDLTVENRFVDVVHDGYDVVIRMASARRMSDSNVASRRLADDQIIVCGAPAYLDRRGRPNEPQELISHACLRYSLGDRQDHWAYELRGKAGAVPITGQLGTNDADVLRESAIAGGGLVIGPSLMMRDALADGRLERLLPGVHFGDVRVYALFADRKHLPAKVRAVVEFLAKELPVAMSGRR